MLRNALLVAAVFLLPALAPAQVKILRHPTYSKGKVAFSYLGDIWIANENGSNPQRLTDNQAREVYPRFSPDGNWIAFSSNRDGNYDVFVVPATGGKPRQLTFHTADDNVVGWTPDSQKVLFSSVRGNGAFPTVATLLEVSLEGGVEQPVPTDWGSSASYSAGWQEAGLHAPSLGLVPQALPRRLCRRPLGARHSHPRVQQNQRPGRLQGQLALAHVRQRQPSTSSPTAPRTKRASVRRPGGDEERQQHLEGLRKGRRARPGDPPRRRQPLLPQHLRRRQDHRLRG